MKCLTLMLVLLMLQACATSKEVNSSKVEYREVQCLPVQVVHENAGARLKLTFERKAKAYQQAFKQQCTKHYTFAGKHFHEMREDNGPVLLAGFMGFVGLVQDVFLILPCIWMEDCEVCSSNDIGRGVSLGEKRLEDKVTGTALVVGIDTGISERHKIDSVSETNFPVVRGDKLLSVDARGERFKDDSGRFQQCIYREERTVSSR